VTSFLPRKYTASVLYQRMLSGVLYSPLSLIRQDTESYKEYLVQGPGVEPGYHALQACAEMTALAHLAINGGRLLQLMKP
jgi:hypothetical protein